MNLKLNNFLSKTLTFFLVLTFLSSNISFVLADLNPSQKLRQENSGEGEAKMVLVNALGGPTAGKTTSFFAGLPYAEQFIIGNINTEPKVREILAQVVLQLISPEEGISRLEELEIDGALATAYVRLATAPLGLKTLDGNTPEPRYAPFHHPVRTKTPSTSTSVAQKVAPPQEPPLPVFGKALLDSGKAKTLEQLEQEMASIEGEFGKPSYDKDKLIKRLSSILQEPNINSSIMARALSLAFSKNKTEVLTAALKGFAKTYGTNKEGEAIEALVTVNAGYPVLSQGGILGNAKIQLGEGLAKKLDELVSRAQDRLTPKAQVAVPAPVARPVTAEPAPVPAPKPAPAPAETASPTTTITQKIENLKPLAQDSEQDVNTIHNLFLEIINDDNLGADQLADLMMITIGAREINGRYLFWQILTDIDTIIVKEKKKPGKVIAAIRITSKKGQYYQYTRLRWSEYINSNLPLHNLSGDTRKSLNNLVSQAFSKGGTPPVAQSRSPAPPRTSTVQGPNQEGLGQAPAETLTAEQVFAEIEELERTKFPDAFVFGTAQGLGYLMKMKDVTDQDIAKALIFAIESDKAAYLKHVLEPLDKSAKGSELEQKGISAFTIIGEKYDLNNLPPVFDETIRIFFTSGGKHVKAMIAQAAQSPEVSALGLDLESAPAKDEEAHPDFSLFRLLTRAALIKLDKLETRGNLVEIKTIGIQPVKLVSELERYVGDVYVYLEVKDVYLRPPQNTLWVWMHPTKMGGLAAGQRSADQEEVDKLADNLLKALEHADSGRVYPKYMYRWLEPLKIIFERWLDLKPKERREVLSTIVAAERKEKGSLDKIVQFIEDRSLRLVDNQRGRLLDLVAEAKRQLKDDVAAASLDASETDRLLPREEETFYFEIELFLLVDKSGFQRLDVEMRRQAKSFAEDSSIRKKLIDILMPVAQYPARYDDDGKANIIKEINDLGFDKFPLLFDVGLLVHRVASIRMGGVTPRWKNAKRQGVRMPLRTPGRQIGAGADSRTTRLPPEIENKLEQLGGMGNSAISPATRPAFIGELTALINTPVPNFEPHLLVRVLFIAFRCYRDHKEITPLAECISAILANIENKKISMDDAVTAFNKIADRQQFISYTGSGILNEMMRTVYNSLPTVERKRLFKEIIELSALGVLHGVRLPEISGGTKGGGYVFYRTAPEISLKAKIEILDFLSLGWMKEKEYYQRAAALLDSDTIRNGKNTNPAMEQLVTILKLIAQRRSMELYEYNIAEDSFTGMVISIIRNNEYGYERLIDSARRNLEGVGLEPSDIELIQLADEENSPDLVPLIKEAADSPYISAQQLAALFGIALKRLQSYDPEPFLAIVEDLPIIRKPLPKVREVDNRKVMTADAEADEKARQKALEESKLDEAKAKAKEKRMVEGLASALTMYPHFATGKVRDRFALVFSKIKSGYDAGYIQDKVIVPAIARYQDVQKSIHTTLRAQGNAEQFSAPTMPDELKKQIMEVLSHKTLTDIRARASAVKTILEGNPQVLKDHGPLYAALNELRRGVNTYVDSVLAYIAPDSDDMEILNYVLNKQLETSPQAATPPQPAETPMTPAEEIYLNETIGTVIHDVNNKISPPLQLFQLIDMSGNGEILERIKPLRKLIDDFYQKIMQVDMENNLRIKLQLFNNLLLNVFRDIETIEIDTRRLFNEVKPLNLERKPGGPLCDDLAMISAKFSEIRTIFAAQEAAETLSFKKLYDFAAAKPTDNQPKVIIASKELFLNAGSQKIIGLRAALLILSLRELANGKPEFKVVVPCSNINECGRIEAMKLPGVSAQDFPDFDLDGVIPPKAVVGILNPTGVKNLHNVIVIARPLDSSYMSANPLHIDPEVNYLTQHGANVLVPEIPEGKDKVISAFKIFHSAVTHLIKENSGSLIYIQPVESPGQIHRQIDDYLNSLAEALEEA